MKSNEKSLALKITLVSFLVLITLLMIIIGSSFFYSMQSSYQSLGQKIQAISSLPQPGLTPPVGNRDNPRRSLQGPRDSIVISTTGGILKNDLFDIDDNDIHTLYSIRNHEIRLVEIDHGAVYLVSRINLDGRAIFVFENIDRIYDFHIALLVIALVGSIIGLIIIYALARYLARITIRPIEEQSRELEAYSHNVAHELRTPLSIMRSNLELLRIKPESRFIDSTDEEITSMENIIDSLLFLAKPETTGNMDESVDIGEQSEKIIEKYLDETNIILKKPKKSIIKHINSELYKRMISNLIENAIKYKSAGDIEMQITKDTILISNPVETNLSEEALSHLTDSFYQADDSRGSSGYGLGLALVSRIIEIFDWTMQIDCSGNIFSVHIRMK